MEDFTPYAEIVDSYLKEKFDDIRDEIWNRFLYLHTSRPLVERGGFWYCPNCGKLFSREHAAQKPKFCEECGRSIDWRDNRE